MLIKERYKPSVSKKYLMFFAGFMWVAAGIMLVSMGIFLRHSAIPKQYLAILYIGIGLALILSSVRYFRHLYWHYE